MLTRIASSAARAHVGRGSTIAIRAAVSGNLGISKKNANLPSLPVRHVRSFGSNPLTSRLVASMESRAVRVVRFFGSQPVILIAFGNDISC